MLAGVQSRRMDITIGGVAWTKDRQKQGLFTDPPYYSPPAMAVALRQVVQDHRRSEGPEPRHRRGLCLGQVDPGRPRREAARLPRRQRRLRRPRPRAASTSASWTRCIIIAAAEGSDPSEDQDRVPDAADRRPGQGQARLRVLPARTRPASTCPRRPPSWRRRSPPQIDAMYKNGELAKLIKKYGGDPDAVPEARRRRWPPHGAASTGRPTGTHRPSTPPEQ